MFKLTLSPHHAAPSKRTVTVARARILALHILVASTILTFAGEALAVGKWEREVLEFSSTSVTGNPFELTLDATFVHAESGKQLTLPAYYAGNSTWKVGFMPTRIGRWDYTTTSTNSELDGISGAIEVTESGLPGMLAASADNPRKWKFSDGGYVVPIGLQFSVLLEEVSDAEFERVARFLAENVGGHLFNFRLSPNDIAFADVSTRQMNIPLWDRLERRMTILRDLGLGVSVMFYTDDSGKPSFGGQTPEEALLIRYAVARLSGFPVVMFNTGIDISEYRSGADIDWWGAQLESLDPYNHPRSSRYGGGSGGDILANQNFDSRGASTAVASDLVGFFQSAGGIPVAVDDNWGEQFSRGNFSPSDIRRAFWKVTIAGGIASHIRDDSKTDFPDANDPDAWFRASDIERKLESEQWLVLINPFIEETFRSAFGAMTPANSLVSGNGVFALADPSVNNLLIYSIGANDSFDSGGGAIDIDLRSTTEDYEAKWFDPRTGNEISAGTLQGESQHTVNPPSSDDWVLYLQVGAVVDRSVPKPPENLIAE